MSAGSCAPAEEGAEAARGSTDRPAAELVLFEGARLFPGNGTVVENGALLVEGDRIVAVGEAGEIPLRQGDPGFRRVDVSGRTIIPALIDTHAHLGYEGYTGWGAAHYSRGNLVDHLHRYAYYGFGAVLSAGSDPEDAALALQRDQRAGEVGGARFLFAAGMAPPDQGPNDRFLVHTRTVAAETGDPVVRGLSSPGDARREVAEVAEKGISFVKLWVDDRGGSQEKLSPEIYRAVMTEARARGLRVLVHQQHASDMPELVRAGTDGFLHGRLGPDLDREVADLLAEEGVFLVPNLGLGELRAEDIAADPFLRRAISPQVAERLDAERRGGEEPGNGTPATVTSRRDRELSAALRRLREAGVSVVLGTDAGAIPDHFFGYTGHRELEILVELGMSPTEALLAATVEAAAALGLEEVGTLEVGKSADFVILERDPTTDIRNTRSILDVYLRGERVNRDSLAARWSEEGGGEEGAVAAGGSRSQGGAGAR